jgi:hypothetical protein
VTLAEAFATLPPQRQANIIKAYIGNELFGLVAGGEDGIMSFELVDAAVRVIEHSPLMRALPQQDRDALLKNCGIVRELVTPE